MPPCAACRMLIDGRCDAERRAAEVLGRALPPAPLGACMLPIVEEYLKLIAPGMQVLEIGCGSWDWIRGRCDSVGAHYEAIDVQREYFGRPTVATRYENLAKLSFETDRFDLVIGNQTLHLWSEHGCTVRWGLAQCFRACKAGGRVLMNVPIHYQGPRAFLLGDLAAIRGFFVPFSDTVELHPWANPSAPRPPHFPHPGYSALRERPAYMLDIRATKDRPVPRGVTNFGAAHGQLAKLLYHPWSYTLYRVSRAMRRRS